MAKTGKRKGIARIPGYILRGINLLFAAGLLVSLTAQFIPPDRIWIPAFFGISFPFWLISNLVFFILWLFRWRRFALLSLVTLLISFPLTLRFFSWPHKKTGEGIPFVTLITYNVKTMYRVENGKPRSTLKNIETVIKAQGADLVCFQEFRENWWDKGKAIKNISSATQLPYIYHAGYYGEISQRNQSSLATFSRFPSIHTETLSYGNRTFALITDLVADKDTFRLINVHLQSISFNEGDHKVLEEISEAENLQREGLKNDSRKILWKLRKGFVRRAAQARRLQPLIESSPYPVIVCGDFNDTPASYTYRTVRGKLRDAFMEGGRGIGNTYLGNLPKIRIDYILLDPAFRCLTHEVLPYRYSDHFAQKTSFYKRSYQ